MSPLDADGDDRKGVWKSGRGKGRRTPKGRQLEDSALAEIRDLLGDRPRRRDLLIEFMHLIQDKYKCLSAAHLRALAEEMRMAQAEVYEVATFYAHFDVVKEGEDLNVSTHNAISEHVPGVAYTVDLVVLFDKLKVQEADARQKVVSWSAHL